MNTPEASKADALALASNSLARAIRRRKTGNPTTEQLRSNTMRAMSDLLDEFGLSDTAAEVADKLVEFKGIHEVIVLHSSKSLSVTLFALENGAIELRSRQKHGDRVVLTEHRVGVQEADVFYERMLSQLGYELPDPRPVLQMPKSLRFHKHTHQRKRPCGLSYPVSIGDNEVFRMSVNFSKKLAIELCHVLAEPLGWELEG